MARPTQPDIFAITMIASLTLKPTGISCDSRRHRAKTLRAGELCPHQFEM